MMSRLLPAALAAWALVAVAPAQRKNDPTTCPWCHGDPALMEQAGIVSHGGFAFGLLRRSALSAGGKPDREGHERCGGDAP